MVRILYISAINSQYSYLLVIHFYSQIVKQIGYGERRMSVFYGLILRDVFTLIRLIKYLVWRFTTKITLLNIKV
jgi:hypothetical protein